MFSLITTLAFAACPDRPALRDPDGQVTVLEQNLKFILTGERRAEREALLADYLAHAGSAVDVLLLEEARLTGTLETWGDDWCFYTQAEDNDGYRWAPIASGRPPGGLAMGIRQRPDGVAHTISPFAGRRFRARPTSLAEGLLGKVAGYHKGWAGLRIDDSTQLVWSHTQASYARHPDVGAGGVGRGRAGQFADLADDLGRPDIATLLTGDLNLLAGFWPSRPEVEARVRRAREIDEGTLADFQARTGLVFTWPWFGRASVHPTHPGLFGAGFSAVALGDPPAGAAIVPAVAEDPGEALAEELDAVEIPGVDGLERAEAGAPAEAPRRGLAQLLGTFAGGVDRRAPSETWDRGAAYDRIGVNEAFVARHPGTRVRLVEIARGWLRVSDHLGLEITIPFDNPRTMLAKSPPSPVEPSPPAERVATAHPVRCGLRRACER